MRKVSEAVLRNHMETCVVEQVRQGNNDVVDEVLTLMQLFQR
ncbi:MAG: hypothetical protein Q4E12_02870 [Coriobacteriia bacterium]|nr:hypothetical protein [Coriobacteriia bacterium]